jgi:ABC-2 type transport system ATP-binding protein
VFLSSHILSEVQHVCDRVGIVRSGRLVTVAQVRDRTEQSLEDEFLSYYREKDAGALPP